VRPANRTDSAGLLLAEKRMPGEMLLRVPIDCGADVRRAPIAVCFVVMAVVGAVLWTNPLAAQSSPPAQSPSDSTIQTLADQAIRRLDLQTELHRQPEPLWWSLKLPPETVWLAVIVGLGVLLYAFRDMVPYLRVNRDGTWELEEVGAAEARSQAPAIALGAADELAAQGHFVEAMHVLLLQALAEIRRRLDEQFADSMTSREILRSKHLSDDLRGPLREVVNRVEWSYFGDHPAEKNDYVACRSSFSAIARVLHGSAAA
jgi:hypothetical protein